MWISRETKLKDNFSPTQDLAFACFISGQRVDYTHNKANIKPKCRGLGETFSILKFRNTQTYAKNNMKRNMKYEKLNIMRKSCDIKKIVENLQGTFASLHINIIVD